ncbi:MAG: acetolactate synthase small subunit [Pyrinomonadaceae bacterium]
MKAVVKNFCINFFNSLLSHHFIRFTPSLASNRLRHTLSIIVADQPGELSRIVGLFSARGFNIETISVGRTLDPQWARVTIVTRGDDRTIEQIVKQCAGSGARA